MQSTPLWLTAAFSALTCATSHVNVVGGDLVPRGTHLYVAGLRHTATGPIFCGAALIHPRFLLTAAHCLPPNGTLRLWASIGATLSNGTDGERMLSLRYTQHPNFNASTKAYDVGVVELMFPSRQPPIPVHWEDDAFYAPNTTAYVHGFGLVAFGGRAADRLEQAAVPIRANPDCAAIFRGVATITDAMLCAGGAGCDACTGDSGGPLIVRTNGCERLIAIVSWGIGCGVPGVPGVYTRLSHMREFVDGIVAPSTHNNTNASSNI
ncbi:Aste57867_7915 [Aphanomyces stellatus]|uniref:Aste57867_7915 protein n=1 Tax=Aphanomyces stellatus TaxID=120398 RepID=A0A485KIY3_9STRA|nr:hypothetical protein As57867_007885 [Aphanomyces stellatus]VFT84808.1 Aste57867_7915 [Aphanomyces stellatus]